MKKRTISVCAVVVLAIAAALGGVAGCGGNLRRAIHDLKELEPKAKKRNAEIRKMTGVPQEQED